MKTLLFACTLALAGSASAATFYVSDCGAGSKAQCVAGNDANAGTSPAAPWKTCAKVTSQFPTLAAGDQVLFAKGSAQTACQLYYLSNLNSRKANPIVLGAYTPAWAPSGSGNPILNATAAGYTLTLVNSGDSTHDEGYVFQDLHFVGTGVTSTLPAVLISNDVDDVTFQRIEVEQYRGGIQCNGGTNSALAAGSNGLSEHIIIRNSSIHNNRGIGILTSCNDSLIENNNLDSNGVGMFDHQIYLDDSALLGALRTTTQIVIRGNTLTNNAPYTSAAAAAPTPGSCGAVAIIVHGNKNGVTIENNFVSEPVVPTNGSCWGIAADDGGYGTKEGFKNVVIRGNTVVNYNMGIGVGMCDTCTVENNNIYSEFKVGAMGISAPAVYYRAATPGNMLNKNLTVRNNTIYLKYPTYESVGVRISRDGSNHAVVSNLVYFGTSSTSATTCFNTLGLTPTAFTAFDNNLCHFSGTGGTWDSNRPTLAAQQAAGFDIHSQTANPGIATPVAPLFALPITTGSPAIHAGHPALSAKLGIGGTKRSATPDIGAFEFGGTVVVPSSPTGVGLQ